ncbi:MAG: hypothetical protein CMJ78_26630 [Planctomycetaceae bacterium]|nr:hypothetical protein [Planctomycetaceae bacterium]
MNCHSVIEILECVRPNSDDLALPEMADAAAHLETCQRCSKQFAAMRQNDSQVAAAVLNVPIPEGLRERILAQVQSNTTELAGDSNSADATGQKLQRRQSWKWAAVVSACVFFGGVFLLSRIWGGGQVSLAEFRELSITNESELLAWRAFDESFAAGVPFGWSRSRSIRFDDEVRGYVLREDTHDVAAFGFTFNTGRKQVRGNLLVIPIDDVADVPTATRFASAKVVYLYDKYATVAWKSATSVYVCFVEGGPGNLETLQSRLRLSAT